MEDTSICSGVLTPNSCINLDAAQMLLGPRNKRLAPTQVTHSQKACSLHYEWDVEDFRVSGNLFHQGAVYLYTKEATEMFHQGATPHIRFFWGFFCQRLGSFQKQNL